MSKAVLNAVSGLGIVIMDDGTRYVIDSDEKTVEYTGTQERHIIDLISVAYAGAVNVFEYVDDAGLYPFDELVSRLRVLTGKHQCVDELIRITKYELKGLARDLAVRTVNELLGFPEVRAWAEQFYGVVPPPSYGTRTKLTPKDGAIFEFIEQISKRH